VQSSLLFHRHREGQSPVAISYLFLEERGYFGDKKDAVHNKERDEANSKNSEEEEK
jgi:hypothetical protein